MLENVQKISERLASLERVRAVAADKGSAAPGQGGKAEGKGHATGEGR